MLHTDLQQERIALHELMKARDLKQLRKELLDLQEADIAFFLDELDPAEAATVFRMLPKTTGMEVFAILQPDTQEALISGYSDQDMKALADALFVDDLADLLEELPATVAKRMLANTEPAKRDLINRILKYPEDSAGSIMTTEYMHLHKDMTVARAIEHLRRSGPRHETIYTCFVTSSDRVLEGIITVRTILTAQDDEIIGDLMETSIVSVRTTDDQELVARLFDHYDFLAIPVVDNEDRLVGIITVDDAVDVMTEEAQEDMSIMAAVQPSEKPYLSTGVFEHARRRVVWLLLLMISGMINGGILSRYESAFVAMPLLVTFIPMLTDTGGNAGSQSSGMMIQGLATGEISFHDLFRVTWKEFRISLVVGFILATVNFLRIYLFYDKNLIVALTVSVALIFTVMLAKLIGGILPLAAKALHMDPAIMAAPLITTIVDATSLIIYFGVAEALISNI